MFAAPANVTKVGLRKAVILLTINRQKYAVHVTAGCYGLPSGLKKYEGCVLPRPTNPLIKFQVTVVVNILLKLIHVENTRDTSTGRSLEM